MRWHDSTSATSPRPPTGRSGALLSLKSRFGAGSVCSLCEAGRSERQGPVPPDRCRQLKRNARLLFVLVLRGHSTSPRSGLGRVGARGRRVVPAHASTTSAGATRRAQLARRGIWSTAQGSRRNCRLCVPRVPTRPSPDRFRAPGRRRALLCHDDRMREPSNDERRQRWARLHATCALRGLGS